MFGFIRIQQPILRMDSRRGHIFKQSLQKEKMFVFRWILHEFSVYTPHEVNDYRGDYFHYGDSAPWYL